MTMDQQFVEFVVKAIVSNPDAVEVERTIDEKGVLLELTVDPTDLGRVIGKRGNTAQSIRTLLRALGTKNDARYNLKIVDNGEDAPRPEPVAVPASADDTNDESTEETDSAVQTDESSGNQWAHLSSTSESNEDETQSDEDDQEEESSTDSTNETIERTKKELADLDDLNL